MNEIMIMFHVPIGTGYAINNLCSTFMQMAYALVQNKNQIHVSFTHIGDNPLNKELSEINNIIEFNPWTTNYDEIVFIKKYLVTHNINIVFGFDIPVWLPIYKVFRRSGVRTLVSYQGAPMSSLNSGLILKLKKLQVLLLPDSPDHYIFESEAMAKTAYLGRGISRKKVSVISLGVDSDKYKPVAGFSDYPHEQFLIPENRKIIYYSGHMEKRKGVDVLINAAKHLYNYHNRKDFHFLILGNKEGEELIYLEMLNGDGASAHVTFGGYRNDVEKIIPACYLGVIASTGWDSFTLSSIEIASCGLPLLVSNLQGLIETIDEGKTGLSFQPGDHKELSAHIVSLLEDKESRNIMGRNARERVLCKFTVQKQIEQLILLMKRVTQ